MLQTLTDLAKSTNPWLVFIVYVSLLFILDLIATSRRKEIMSFRQSLLWTAFWVLTAGAFNFYIYFLYQGLSGNGMEKYLEFLTGYLVEQSLSVDNLFVFLMIFGVMRTAPESQGIGLKWGIFGAIVLRVIFVVVGIGLLNLFEPVIYLFAVIILYAAYKMIRGGEEKIEPENNFFVRLAEKMLPVSYDDAGKRRFFLRTHERLHITPLLLTVILILTTDLVFAVDSIPAIIAITRDPYIVISSNIFAVLGLQALFFAFAKLAEIFYYLKHGVALILAFVGVKMLIAHFYKIPTLLSLVIVVAVILISILISVIVKRSKKAP